MNSIAQFNHFSSSNYNNFHYLSDVIFRHKAYSQELARVSLIDLFNTLDERFYKQKSWKKHFKFHGCHSRTLITLIGVISFKRRYYVALDKTKHSNFYLIDSYFKLPKYARITNDAMHALIKQATEVNATYAANNALWDCRVSRQSVSNILKSFTPFEYDIPKIPEIIEKYNESKETLFIELDEAHCNLQVKNNNDNHKKNKIAKLVLLHTGHNHCTFASKRKELENKHYFGDLNPDTSILVDRVNDYIHNRFKTSEVKHIFVSGDGAWWINSFARNLKDCLKNTNIEIIQVLDKFHLRKRLTRIFSNNKTLINIIFKNLNTLTENEFKIIANDFYLNNQQHKLDPKTFISNVNFICNNFVYIKNNNHPKYTTPCSMEGHISHVYASRLTSRPKGFSIKTLESLVQLLVLKANLYEITIQDLSDWKNQKTKQIKVRNLSANKMIKRYYDFNVDLYITNSSNTKMKDHIHNITSPKWYYS